MRDRLGYVVCVMCGWSVIPEILEKSCGFHMVFGKPPKRGGKDDGG